RKSTQTSDLSWWPKPSAWTSAGINVGYWSEDCERWFQNRLARINEGKFDLRSPAKWKSGLSFNKRTSKVTARNEQYAAEYLRRHGL
ncbi:hypothetical protein FPV67DRAFT_1427985, partial [Lyophyllum atratum]